MGVVELHKVGPCDAPCTGGDEGAVRGAMEPVGMVRLEGGCPAGVVGGEIHEEAAALGVDGVHQLAELV